MTINNLHLEKRLKQITMEIDTLIPKEYAQGDITRTGHIHVM
jgi:hypothetical protein